MALTWIFIDAPVCALQFDVQTGGLIALAPEITTKELRSNAIGGGVQRVVIFGLNQNVFSGRVAICSDVIASISNISASSPDGVGVAVTMKWISKVTGLVASLAKQ